MSKQRSFTKKEMKKDSLVVGYYRAVQLYEQYKSYVNWALVVLVVAVVAIIFFINNRQVENEKASLALAKIMPAYENGMYDDAMNGSPGTGLMGLKEIVSQYGSTENGQTAKILLANAYFFKDNLDSALILYKDFGGDNEMMVAAAYAGKASVFEAQQKHEDAADMFVQASSVSKSNPLNPKYIINAAINFIEIGKIEKAREMLKQVKKDYKTSPYIRDADRYLLQTE